MSRSWLALVLVALIVIVVFELAAGTALRPPRPAHNEAKVLALPGVATMLRGVSLDPTELAQVAAHPARPTPLALPAQALIDGLLLVTVTGLALPRFLPRLPDPVSPARDEPASDAPARDAPACDAPACDAPACDAPARDAPAHDDPTPGNGTGAARVGSFVLSLAILLVSIAVAVVAIARLRYLVALYLSPPLGTLSYLLRYGSFRRGAGLWALTGLMVLKVGVCLIVVAAFPRAATKRGLGALALTSVAATVVTTLCYALAPSTLGAITDSLAAASVALAALLWAGVIVSGSVRRLA